MKSTVTILIALLCLFRPVFGAIDLTSEISATLTCNDDEFEILIKQTAGALINTYIAFGPGGEMADMDPVICTINNTKGIDCKDYGSSEEGTAPT